MDILGPFSPAIGQRKFSLVAIDYFTKWVEAEPLAQITEAKVENFVRNHIIFHFGIPKVIITNNGRQFDNTKFKKFCALFHIDHKLTSIDHPQANGEAKVTNRTILHGLKTRLNDAKGLWADKLNSILWAYRMTPRAPTGETPFSLSYGSEVIILVETTLQSFWIDHFTELANSDQRRTNLDLLEETRVHAGLKMAIYRQRMVQHYNKRLKPRSFTMGDLVLHKAEVSQSTDQGKFSPNWEGPYKVIEVVRPGTY